MSCNVVLFTSPFCWCMLLSNLLQWCYVGVEVSITEPEDLITVKGAKIVVESQDEDKIQVCLWDSLV